MQRFFDRQRIFFGFGRFQYGNMERMRADVSIGQLLADAMERRSRRLGREYSYRELGRDSGVDFSYIWRIVHESRQPSRQKLRDLARALGDDLSLDEAMVAAGYMPDRYGRLSARRILAALDHALHSALVEPVPDQDAEAQGRCEPERKQQPDHPRTPAPCSG